MLNFESNQTAPSQPKQDKTILFNEGVEREIKEIKAEIIDDLKKIEDCRRYVSLLQSDASLIEEGLSETRHHINSILERADDSDRDLRIVGARLSAFKIKFNDLLTEKNKIIQEINGVTDTAGYLNLIVSDLKDSLKEIVGHEEEVKQDLLYGEPVTEISSN